jgi:hypothetical protein
MNALSLAQKVRLWSIAGTELLSAILIIVAVSAFNFYPDLGITEGDGNLTALIGWIFISQVAVITLGTITFIRFLNPKAPASKAPVPPAPPAGYYAPAPNGPGAPTNRSAS